MCVSIHISGNPNKLEVRTNFCSFLELGDRVWSGFHTDRDSTQPSNVRQSGFDNVVPLVEAFHGETQASKEVRRDVEGNMLQTGVSFPVIVGGSPHQQVRFQAWF